jgi:hypothetical protein
MNMKDVILVGRGREISELPRAEWEARLSAAPERIARRLDFMSAEHHMVRNFAVTELPRSGRPLRPDFIARGLGLAHARVNTILDDLERHLFFLVRNGEGEVSWAFPVTTDETPHRLRFSTGEQVYAA